MGYGGSRNRNMSLTGYELPLGATSKALASVPLVILGLLFQASECLQRFAWPTLRLKRERLSVAIFALLTGEACVEHLAGSLEARVCYVFLLVACNQLEAI